MKKIILLTLITILIPINISAQKQLPLSKQSALIKFGLGIGIGCTNTNSPTYKSLDVDIICCNTFLTIKDICNFNTHDITSAQIGILIPLLYNTPIEKGNIFIAPMAEFISEDYHEKIKHDEEKHNYTEIGAAIMLRYKYNYIMTKFTQKTLSITIGLTI